jgi:hypothetical protein
MHAFDHVLKGTTAGGYYSKLKSIVYRAGFEEIELAQFVERWVPIPRLIISRLKAIVARVGPSRMINFELAFASAFRW